MNEVRAAMTQRFGLLCSAIAVWLESQPRRKDTLAAPYSRGNGAIELRDLSGGLVDAPELFWIGLRRVGIGN